MLPRDPREVTREEMGRQLADLLAAIDEERERAALARKESRERIAELQARVKGIRDFLRGRKGAQVPLALVTEPAPRGDA